MSYHFPVIRDIQQVLDAIAGREEFVVKHDEANGYKVVNYLVNFEDTFPEVLTERDALLRECRGITFDAATGKVISRKYHKFFNLNERPETQADFIDWTQPHVVLEKLDGSMITPLWANGKIRWCTKMGMTGIAEQVNEFVRNNVHYEWFAAAQMSLGRTPIFEWCSRKQRIVLDYPEDRLVLTAIRYNETGNYLNYQELKAEAKLYQLETVRALPGTAENIQQFMAEAHDIEGAEGYVIRFQGGHMDGHMLKVKGAWYCQLHNIIDQFKFEKNVIRLILDEKLDDAKPFLPKDLMEAADGFGQAIFTSLKKRASDWYWMVQERYDNFNGGKKRFAQEFAMLPENRKDSQYYFAIWDAIASGEDGEEKAYQLLWKTVHDATATRTKVEEARYLYGGAKWDDFIARPEE